MSRNVAAPVEALVKAVNTVGIMGRGNALQFKQAYPALFREYERACKAGEVRLGKVQVFVLAAWKRLTELGWSESSAPA